MPAPALAQELSNALFSGFDDAFREVGVSDVGVPKKMKKLAGAFIGRGNAYSEAFAQGETALAAGAGAQRPRRGRRRRRARRLLSVAPKPRSMKRRWKHSCAAKRTFPGP